MEVKKTITKMSQNALNKTKQQMEREFQAERKKEKDKIKKHNETRAIPDAHRRKKEKATKRALEEETLEDELENRITERSDAYENNNSPPRKTS